MSNDSFHIVPVGLTRFDIDKRYDQLRLIGDGSYSFVVSAHDSVTNQRVAIKKIRDTFLDVADAKRILRELKLLRHFRAHENIVSVLDIMSVPPNSENIDDIYIVTNLMESDLERIIRSRQALTNQHLQYFLYQILRGLKYVHSANVLHRDLKPSNLLVNSNCDLTLCDFGLSRGIEQEGVDILTGYVVTRWYRAPELLCDNHNYGKPVDIWSVGCILAELILQQPFFLGDSPPQQLGIILSKIQCPPLHRLDFISNSMVRRQVAEYVNYQVPELASFFPKEVSRDALDLLGRMLQFHPNDRITVEEALAHPYLRDFHNQMPEPCSRTKFEVDFEVLLGPDVDVKQLRKMMYEEVCLYRPPSSEPKPSDFRSDDPKSHSYSGDRKQSK